MLYNLQLVYKVTNVLLLIFTDVIMQFLLLRVDNSLCNLPLVYKVTNTLTNTSQMLLSSCFRWRMRLQPNY